MSELTTVHLLRHGEVHNPGKVLYGRLPGYHLSDLGRAMAQLRPREREMLWLAYAQGSNHRDIAGTLGVKAESVRLLLFRARRKLARLLRSDRRLTTSGKADHHGV